METFAGIVQNIKNGWKAFVRTRSSCQKEVTELQRAVSQERYNILLIGETGSGKTSFLNLLCFLNLIQELGWEEALKRRHSSFHNQAFENGKPDDMESRTSQPQYYQFCFDGVNVGILDTPGFGDTRGFDVDKENVKNIVDQVNKVECIHCICLVINGSQSRMTHQLKYVVSEISAILPRATVKNVLIVFTNAKDKSKSNFNIKTLTNLIGIEIPESCAFYFDNPYCGFQKVPPTDIPKGISQDFDDASKTFESMCNKLAEFERIYTTVFINLYLIKVAVERKTCQLALQAEYKAEVEQKLVVMRKQVDDALEKVGTRVHVQSATAWIETKTDKHNTLCSLCNSNCHTPCFLKKAITKEELKSCSAMQPMRTVCSVCSHSYEYHYHDSIVFSKKTKELIPDSIIVAFNNSSGTDDAKTQAQKLRDDMEMTLKEAEREFEDTSKDLINQLQQFEEQASIQSYKQLLECQLKLVQFRIATDTKGSSFALQKTKNDLAAKLKMIEGIHNSIPPRDKL